MNTNINEMKMKIENIEGVLNIDTISFIESDKLHVKINLKELANHKAIKEEIIRFVKIDCGIPKLKYEQEIIKDILPLDNAKKIIIASGKGGVGKSSVTANIANVLSQANKKVAVIDADIYGSSIPMIFGLEGSPEQIGDKLLPLTKENIQFIGSSNVNPNNEPIVWRGPMLGRLINNFFRDVAWDSDTEYLLIDLPPGTGDIPLDLNSLIPDAKTIIVTTPHVNASKVAIKAGEMAKLQKHDIIGVVENMSYFLYNDEKLEIFGNGGGDKVASSLNTNLVAKLPILEPNNGHLYSVSESSYDIYKNLCNKIEESF